MPNLIRALGFSLLIMLSPHLFAAPERLALVIGNAAYAKPLKNPGNDADAMTAALQRAGFHVTTRKDLRLGEMKSAINDFGVRLNHNTIGLIYFAGHGVQTEDNRNYLLPIGADTDVVKPAQLPDGAVSLDFIRGAMDGGGLNLIFLDACRDNPYAFTRGSGKRGLAPMTSGGNDTLIAYATAAGDTADDSDAYGDNSPYTASLIKWMAEPLPIEILLKKVRADVMRQTHGSQRPIYNPEFTQDFYFKLPGKAIVENKLAGEYVDTNNKDRNIIDLKEANKAFDNEDYQRAFNIYKLLAEEGNAEAQFRLGVLYDFGSGTEQDEDKALKWFARAYKGLLPLAENGKLRAQYLLAQLYDMGKGIEQDSKKAKEWWVRAYRGYLLLAEQGDAEAQYWLGWLLFSGEGVDEDESKAIEWFKKSAAQNNINAQFILGRYYGYDFGYSMEINYKKSVEYFEKAAIQGHVGAQWRLGDYYNFGIHIERDVNKALKWYEKAAKQGNAIAQSALGKLYEDGDGVKQNYSKAREWYKKAADQGNKNAKEALQRLQNK